MSGSSNISDGLFEFDLSLLPAGTTINSVTLKLRTAQLISNTSDESNVNFFAFLGNGVLEVEDQAAGGVLVQSEVFQSGTPDNVELEIELANIAVFNDAINDGNLNDYITMRSETENFVLMRVDSLESTEPGAMAATLVINFTGGLLLGDLNRDCEVTLLDVAPFIDAVAAGDYVPAADCNEDGAVNLLDVAAFIEILSGG